MSTKNSAPRLAAANTPAAPTQRGPRDHLPSDAPERKAQPFKKEVDSIRRIIRNALKKEYGNGLAKTCAEIVSQHLKKRLWGYDQTYISKAGIAKATKLGRATVQRGLAKLNEFGVWYDAGNSLGGHGKAADRRVDWPALMELLIECEIPKKNMAQLQRDLGPVLKAIGEPESGSREPLKSGSSKSHMSHQYDDSIQKQKNGTLPIIPFPEVGDTGERISDENGSAKSEARQTQPDQEVTGQSLEGEALQEIETDCSQPEQEVAGQNPEGEAGTSTAGRASEVPSVEALMLAGVTWHSAKRKRDKLLAARGLA